MKSILFAFLIIGALPLAALKCDGVLNPDPKLPPVTTEGKNRMGCKINGEVWDIMGEKILIIKMVFYLFLEVGI